jgi:hypothetical protein
VLSQLSDLLSFCFCRLRKAVKQLLQEAHAASQAAGQALDASLAAKLGSTKLLKDELAAQVCLVGWLSSRFVLPALLMWQATCTVTFTYLLPAAAHVFCLLLLLLMMLRPSLGTAAQQCPGGACPRNTAEGQPAYVSAREAVSALPSSTTTSSSVLPPSDTAELNSQPSRHHV